MHATQHYNSEHHNHDIGNSLPKHFTSHRKTNNLHLLAISGGLPICVQRQENWTSMGKVVTLSKHSSDNPKIGICTYYNKFKSWSEEISAELLSLPIYSVCRWHY
jgi:hypothetical protein